MSYRRTIDFLLHDWLEVESLRNRPRFAEHSRETFDAVLDTCEKIAREKFAPYNRLADTEEPWFDGHKVHLPEPSHAAARAYFESGMLAASQDYELGGMQLPCVVEMAANSFFSKAGIGIGGGGMLTSGNANLLMAHGTTLQKDVFAKNEFAGRFTGTMCLSEPQAGSQPLRHPHPGDARRRGLRERSARPALSPARQQDVDLERRQRAGREHRPPGACQDPRRGRASSSPAPAASRSSSCRRSWSTRRASSPASATTSPWPASTTSSATAASRTRCSTSARASIGCAAAGSTASAPARSATSSASRARACAACST